MTTSVIPLAPEAARVPARVPDAAEGPPGDGAFEDRLAKARDTRDAAAEAPDETPHDPDAEPSEAAAVAVDAPAETAQASAQPATPAESELDTDTDTDDAAALAGSAMAGLQVPPAPLPAPTADSSAQVATTADVVEPGGQPVLATGSDKAGPQLFELEEVPPAQAPAASAPATASGSDLTDLGEQGDDAPASHLTDAAAAFDVEAAELDGLIEPEAIAEVAPEPQDTPELPVAELGRLRVKIDDDLAVEVSSRSGRVDVAVEGTNQALREVQDLGPELAASLSELGFELGGFTQQERDGSQGEGGSADGPAGEAKAQAPRRASGGRFVNRLA